jgi:hypothetical protein
MPTHVVSRNLVRIPTAEIHNTNTNHLTGPGCYKRAKEHLKSHIEIVRGIMFHAAVRRVEGSLSGTLDELQSEVEAKMKHIVAIIDKDYRALLADGNIFKALSAARDELRNVLTQVATRSKVCCALSLKVPTHRTRCQPWTSMTKDHLLLMTGPQLRSLLAWECWLLPAQMINPLLPWLSDMMWLDRVEPLLRQVPSRLCPRGKRENLQFSN